MDRNPLRWTVIHPAGASDTRIVVVPATSYDAAECEIRELRETLRKVRASLVADGRPMWATRTAVEMIDAALPD